MPYTVDRLRLHDKQYLLHQNNIQAVPIPLAPIVNPFVLRPEQQLPSIYQAMIDCLAISSWPLLHKYDWRIREGRVIVKVEPLPSVDSTSMVP